MKTSRDHGMLAMGHRVALCFTVLGAVDPTRICGAGMANASGIGKKSQGRRRDLPADRARSQRLPRPLRTAFSQYKLEKAFPTGPAPRRQMSPRAASPPAHGLSSTCSGHQICRSFETLGQHVLSQRHRGAAVPASPASENARSCKAWIQTLSDGASSVSSAVRHEGPRASEPPGAPLSNTTIAKHCRGRRMTAARALEPGG